jgi:hypothetical protein
MRIYVVSTLGYSSDGCALLPCPAGYHCSRLLSVRAQVPLGVIRDRVEPAASPAKARYASVETKFSIVTEYAMGQLRTNLDIITATQHP